MVKLMNRIKAQCHYKWKVKACRYDEIKHTLEARTDMPHGENIKGNILSNWYDISDITEYWIDNRHYRVGRISLGLANRLERAEAEIYIPELEEEHKNELEKQYREAYNKAKKR